MGNRVKWLGHSTFEVVTGGGLKILIDPWITGNPSCPVNKEELQGPDAILITHDHFDHLGEDVPYLVSGSDAIILAQPEIVSKLKEAGVDDNNFIYGMGMNIGGTVQVENVEITMVQAFHSALTGSPAGFIIGTEDKKGIYHAGDTGVFGDMKLLSELYSIDLALLPIGSVFVMDPLQAAQSLQLLNPRRVVPMHYGTFPILVQDTEEFIELARQKAPHVEIDVIEPGEELEF